MLTRGGVPCYLPQEARPGARPWWNHQGLCPSLGGTIRPILMRPKEVAPHSRWAARRSGCHFPHSISWNSGSVNPSGSSPSGFTRSSARFKTFQTKLPSRHSVRMSKMPTFTADLALTECTLSLSFIALRRSAPRSRKPGHLQEEQACLEGPKDDLVTIEAFPSASLASPRRATTS